MNKFVSPETPTVYAQLETNAANSQTEALIAIRRSVGALAAVAALGVLTHGAPENINPVQQVAAAEAPSKPILHDTQQSSPKHEQGIYLRSVDELSGFGLKVKKETRKTLADSTLKLLRRSKDPLYDGDTRPWAEVCTLNLVTGKEFQGQGTAVGLTAAHCLGIPDAPGGSKYDFTNPPAVDVLPASDYEFAVADPRAMPDNRLPIGLVTNISMSQRGNDFALLKIVPNPEPRPPESGRKLEEIKRMRYRPATNPIPGEQVALTSVPVASGNHIGSTVGRYFGEYYLEGSQRRVSIVGIKPPKAASDKCNYAASGSSAIGQGGTIFTALSIRINSGYKDGTVQDNDVYVWDANSQQVRYVNNTEWRAKIERSLGVDTYGYSTLCGYTSTGYGKSDQGFIKGMVRGFAHPLPPRPDVAPVSDDPNVTK